MAKKILVVGAGGIGGVLTALLSESGHDVVAATTNEAIHQAITREGFRLSGDGEARAVRGRIELGTPSGPFDFVVMATQPPQVEDACRDALGALAPGGHVVCLQNGLCEERLGAIVGPERVIGAVVAWGASMSAPGVYERTAQGGFTVGRLDGTIDAPVRELAAILEVVGPAETTTNLRGKRWSKLAINAAISSLGTLGGDRLGVLMQHRFVRRLALEVMSEATEVAQSLGVKLEKVSGTIDLEWLALTPEERDAAGSPSLVAKHGLLLAVGFRYRKMRSSMLSALERGRPPAIDFLNGEVVTRARDARVEVPVNAALREMVWAVARRERESSLESLRALFEATGPHGR